MQFQTHPGLPEFEYVRPASMEDACQFLAAHPDARPFLGGTDCFVRMRDGFFSPAYLVDVKGFDGMNTLRFDPAEGLEIGAAVPMNAVIADPQVQARYPLLAEAARSVASYQLRNRATIVGNICNASPAGDTIGACLVLNGQLTVCSPHGTRSLDLASFFTGPGRTVLQPGDVVTGVRFPLPPAGAVGRYIKLGRNRLSDLAIVGITVLGYPDPRTASGFAYRIALASVGPTPLRVPAAESLLAAEPITEQRIALAALAAMNTATPIDDVRSTASYRKRMVRNLTREALTSVWSRLQATLTEAA
jgi:carbon-monoxide dehydrogenase medium subunit